MGELVNIEVAVQNPGPQNTTVATLAQRSL